MTADAAATASASPVPSGVVLAPSIAPTASASLSSLIQLSDLAYPELAPRYVSSRALPTASPWRSKLIPNPLAPIPNVPSIAPAVEPSLRERLQAGLSQMDGFTASPMKPAAASIGSSRSLLDPTSRLLESLWAAEDDFERMLAEELPDLGRDRRPAQNAAATPQRDHDARRREEATKLGLIGEPHHPSPAPSAAVAGDSRSDRTPARRTHHSARSSPMTAAAAVHFAPGALLPSADEITAAYVDPLPAQAASPIRSSSASLRHSPPRSLSPPQRDLARAITSALQPGQRFLHVSEWDGRFEPDAVTDAALASADPAAGISSTAAVPAVLLGVQEFSMPATLHDVLDVDVDSQGRLVRFDVDRAFGRLVPLRAQHILRQVELKTPTLDEEEKQQESHGRSHQARGAVPTRSLSPPRSLTALAAALPRASSSSVSPRLVRSHLHSAPDPALVHRAVAVRAAQDSMREIDDDLAALEAQAAALSAEYQSDSRKLAAYQARIKARSQHALSNQLDAVQQQWLQAQQTSEQARRTLAQIDAIMADGEANGQPARDAAAQSTASQTASARRPHTARLSTTPRVAAGSIAPSKHRNVQHSPPRSSRTDAAAPSVAAPSASTLPRHRPLTASNSSASVSSRSVRPAGPTKAALPATRYVKQRKTAGKLEGELDSALQQAQKLMEQFVGNI